MAESLAGEAKWTDVDRETFMRFIQFAYIGDYSVPVMVANPIVQIARQDVDEENAGEAEPEIADDNWANFGTPMKSKKKSHHIQVPKLPRPLPKPFKSLTYPLLKPRSNFAHTCDPAINKGSNENISEVLLMHASLYVFAEKWGVDSLKKLTLFKLHQTMSILWLDLPKVPHIVKLARYVYSDERTPDLNNGIDQLRELVCLYVAANTEVMSEHPTFIELIEEGGAFVRDLWKHVVPRICRTE